MNAGGEVVLDPTQSGLVLERTAAPHSCVRHLELNRPKALHALTSSMCAAVRRRVQRLEAATDVRCIVLSARGTAGRAFCAGGDVRALYEAGMAGDYGVGDALFREEYSMNALLGSLSSTSLVSLLDGITMGGGVGLAVHGRFRVATENTVFAMPECAIGLSPDIGASYFLSRLSAGVGAYLGLTGARLRGKEVFVAGIATHFIPSDSLPELVQALESASVLDAATIDGVLTKYSKDGESGSSTLVGQSVMKRCFTKDGVEEIMSALEEEGSSAEASPGDAAFAKKALGMLKKGNCPTTMKVAFESIRQGKSKTLKECLDTEFRVTVRCVRREDFYSGVRSALVTKDRNPLWVPSSLANVSAADVQRFFEPLDTDLGIPELGLVQPDETIERSRL